VHRINLLGSKSAGMALNILRAISRADLVVIGGGGLLQDYLPNFYRPYIRTAIVAKALRKKVVWFGVGAYPPRTETFRRWMAGLGHVSDLVSVRDEPSFGALRQAGFGGNVRVIADPAFAHEAGCNLAVPSRVCISLRPWWNIKEVFGVFDTARLEGFGCIVAQSLDRFVEETSAEIFMLPMQKCELEDDAAFEAWVANKMTHKDHVTLLPYRGFREVLHFLGTCSMTVGMRLHSLVLSAALGVPTVGIAYDPKIKAVMRALQREDYLVDAGDVSSATLSETLIRAWEQRNNDTWRASIPKWRADLESFAHEVLQLR